MDRTQYLQSEIDRCEAEERDAKKEISDAGSRMRRVAKKRGELQLELIKTFQDKGSVTATNESKPAAKAK